jgi:hypothetical protein
MPPAHSSAFQVGRGFEGGAYREATCALGVSDSERGSEGLLGGDHAFLCNLTSYDVLELRGPAIARSQGHRSEQDLDQMRRPPLIVVHHDYPHSSLPGWSDFSRRRETCLGDV